MTMEHADPRGLKKSELLERFIKTERENKKLSKQVQRLEDEQKECLAVHEDRVANLNMQIEQTEDMYVSVKRREQTLMEDASNLREELRTEQSMVGQIMSALQPVIAPEIKEAERRAEQAEKELVRFRKGIAQVWKGIEYEQ
jgi:seryl-tRNA synthetase